MLVVWKQRPCSEPLCHTGKSIPIEKSCILFFSPSEQLHTNRRPCHLPVPWSIPRVTHFPLSVHIIPSCMHFPPGLPDLLFAVQPHMASPSPNTQTNYTPGHTTHCTLQVKCLITLPARHLIKAPDKHLIMAYQTSISLQGLDSSDFPQRYPSH